MLPLNCRVQLGIGDYYTKDLIHNGSMFTVFRARNILLERDEALKMAHANGPRLLHDARLFSRLSHPSNLRLLSLGHFSAREPQPVMVMEMVDQMPLAALGGVKLSPLRACRILGQLLGALNEAHSVGLLYGTLNPQTIALSAEVTERVRIADYGMSSPLEEDIADPGALVSGNPAYVAPERFMGAPRAVSGDLFSLGVLMYKLLCGQLPFPHSGFGLLRAYQRGEQPRPLHELTSLPLELSQLVHRMIEVDEARRFRSAWEVATSLLRLDPDELLAYSEVPLHERTALGMNIPVSAERPSPPPLPLEAPVIWVLSDDPAMRNANTQAMLVALRRRYEVRELSAEERPKLADTLQQGEISPPWVVLFGDLHIILGDPLLESLGQQGLLSRVLISTHLNAELLHSTVNTCSLDQQILASMSSAEMLGVVETMVQRAGRLLERSGEAELRLRNAQEKVYILKHQLADLLDPDAVATDPGLASPAHPFLDRRA